MLGLRSRPPSPPNGNDPPSLVTGAVVEVPTVIARKAELEARFCEVFTMKAEAEQKVRELHDELMRIQGAIREVTSPTE